MPQDDQPQKIMRDVSKDDEESTSNSEEHSEVFRQESFNSESKYLDGKLKFFPPVYVQRYEAVNFILQQPPWKDEIRKVVDFGCSEMRFFLYLKHLFDLDEILEVDIDESLLLQYAAKAAPLNSDYLLRKRVKPLTVYLLAGSIADYDDHLQGTDAVIAIEVIEHLKPDVLKKFPHNVFHQIKPKLAIFTTPNSDFNELFPDHVGFRHADHQFEWSRKEFYKWTREITSKYPEYSVRFYGIGVGPEGTENLGCCTQMAVFERQGDLEETPAAELKGINNYKLIRKYDYPFYVDERTTAQKVMDEIMYQLKFSETGFSDYNNDDGLCEIPLSEFMHYITEWCQSEEELKEIFISYGFYVKEKDGVNVLLYFDQYAESSEIFEEESSMDLNVIQDIPKEDNQSECWDWDCGDRDFNCPTPEWAPEDELPNFHSARSLQDVADKAASEIGEGHQSLEEFGYSETIGDGRSSADSMDNELSNSRFGEVASVAVSRSVSQELYRIRDGKSRSATQSSIPRKRNFRGSGMRNSSKSAKTLVRFGSWPHLGGDISPSVEPLTGGDVVPCYNENAFEIAS